VHDAHVDLQPGVLDALGEPVEVRQGVHMERDVLAEIEQGREVLVAVGLLAEVVEEGQAVGVADVEEEVHEVALVLRSPGLDLHRLHERQAEDIAVETDGARRVERRERHVVDAADRVAGGASRVGLLLARLRRRGSHQLFPSCLLCGRVCPHPAHMSTSES
jgi:hypothetical protein